MKIGTIATIAALGVSGAADPSGPGPSPATAAAIPPVCSAEAADDLATIPLPAPRVDPSAYYAIDLVTTKKVPGTARARGTGHLTFARSPYGVALGEDGSYRYDVSLRLEGMDRPTQGTLVAWLTTPQVDRVERLGAFGADLRVDGQVAWNKFLVVITLEPTDDASATAWTGPIVLRGMSRSGAMHTMAGHGPFQQELCAKYGYR